MDIESLFSGTRWQILKAVSKEKLSPLELAEMLKTTSANVSQQLRLLELAGLVKSERISNVEKGKPRIVYSLSGDNAYLILLTSDLAEKNILSLTDYHKYTLKSWFTQDKEHHTLLGELYFKLQEYLDSVEIIAVKPGRELIVYILLNSKEKINAVKKVMSEIRKIKPVVELVSDFRFQENLVYLFNKMGEVKT